MKLLNVKKFFLWLVVFISIDVFASSKVILEQEGISVELKMLTNNYTARQNVCKVFDDGRITKTLKVYTGVDEERLLQVPDSALLDNKKYIETANECISKLSDDYITVATKIGSVRFDSKKIKETIADAMTNSDYVDMN